MIQKFLKFYPGEGRLTKLKVCQSAHIGRVKILKGLGIGEVVLFGSFQDLDRRGSILTIYFNRRLNCGQFIVLNLSMKRMVIFYRIHQFLSSRSLAGSREGKGENRSCAFRLGSL